MSLINNIIDKQGFEVVRDTIGAVLKTELQAQKILQGFEDPINIYIGRSARFQQSEKVMINVTLDSASYSNANQKSVHGFTNYHIDIYVSAKEKEDLEGGYSASIKRDKFVGMVRYVLQDHHYKTLNLPTGLIMGTEIEGFENGEPTDTSDAAFVKMSRVTFGVRINECQSLWEGIDISSIFTGVKLDLTNRGYYYETEIN